jgi:hypothetical protein
MAESADIPITTALANGAVMASILDCFVVNGMLSRKQVRSILKNARRELGSGSDPFTVHAERLIGIWSRKFSDG